MAKKSVKAFLHTKTTHTLSIDIVYTEYILCYMQLPVNHIDRPRKDTYMLKKLVKYGNSHALILDKAILELLNIEEGSTIKIKTDGTSIIITPHSPAIFESVKETFTQENAYREALAKEFTKKQKNIDTKAQEKIEKKFTRIMANYQKLNEQLAQNPEFKTQIKLLAQQLDSSSAEFVKASIALKNQLYPEFIALEKELADLTPNNTPTSLEKPNLSQKEQQLLMAQEFAAIHKKYSSTHAAYGELLNNTEYQHKAQLIAEKYNFDKNSTDYLKAIDELNYTYLPEMLDCQTELKAVAQKYTNNTP